MKKLAFILLNILLITIVQLNAQAPELWGVTSSGGQYNAGTIFKTDINGNNHSVKFDMYKHEAEFPVGDLLQASNGKFYGLTEQGGIFNMGVLFEYDLTTDLFKKLIDFNGAGNGMRPKGNLMEAANGKLYGLTSLGGVNNNGVLFEYEISSNIFTKKIDFDAVNTGSQLQGTLIQATNGKFYGLAYGGGLYSTGVLFEYDLLLNTITKKVNFGIANKGKRPTGNLIQALNGKLYGMTTYGGVNDDGVLFSFDIATGVYTKKIDFGGFGVGRNPGGDLIEISNGKFYGLTSSGGLNDYGVLFEYNDSTNGYIEKVDFDLATKGSHPGGSLIQGLNGKFYGLTGYGGIYNHGTLFEYDLTTDIFIKKVDFDRLGNGCYSYGSLIQATNGKFYGLNYEGGIEDKGVLFEYDLTTDIFTKKIDFDAAEKGKELYGSLIQSSNGKFYGLTKSGGEFGDGILFEYDGTTNSFITKIDFECNINGCNPEGGLIQSSNGKFYGLTRGGGVNYSGGVLFEYDAIANTIINKVEFDGANKGTQPKGDLLLANNGKFYGLTSSGGMYNSGVLFEYDITTNVFTKKFDFGVSKSPNGSLTQAINGKLYGLTCCGGAHSKGVLFEYDLTTNIYATKINFNGTDKGHRPNGDLVEGVNGMLYGLTFEGGLNDFGVLFEYDPLLDVFTKKIDFDGVNGSSPLGSLKKASNGNFYGLTSEGGVYDKGVLFEYDELLNILTKKLDFDGVNGSNPYATKLIETNFCSYSTNNFNITTCNSYTVPSGDETYSAIGEYTVNDTILNSCGSDSILTINLKIDASGTDIQIACDTFTWIDGVQYNSNNDTATYIIIDGSVNGCDSLVFLDLTVNYSKTITLNTELCSGDSFTYADGISHTNIIINESHVSTFTGQAINGCDSFVIENISVLPISVNTINSEVCIMDSYTYVDGTTHLNITENETYISTLFGQAVNGCDSVVIENVIVLPIAVNSINAIICRGDSYTYADGTMHSNILEDEMYISTLIGQAVNGCDSVVTENISVLMIAVNSINTSICRGDSYTYINGVTHTNILTNESFVSTLIGQAVNGCDSVVTENISVLPISLYSINAEICSGDSYTYIDGTSHLNIISNETHISKLFGQAINGCDSIVTENIIVNSIEVSISQMGYTLVSSLSNASYKWIDCDTKKPIEGATDQSFTATENGSFAVIIDDDSCIDTSNCYTILGLGLDDNENDFISIYPNPSNGKIIIEGKDIKSISITDVNGNLIQQKTNIKAQTSFNISKETKGLYFVSVTTKNGVTIKKIVYE